MSVQDINLTDAELGEVTGGHIAAIAVIGLGLFATGLIGGFEGLEYGETKEQAAAALGAGHLL